MNEREEFLIKFNEAMPLIEKLDKNEIESSKLYKTKDRVTKAMVVVAGILILGIIIYVAVGEIGSFIAGSFPLWIVLALIIFLFVNNKKKIKKNEEEMVQIINSDELSFIPFSYRRQSFEMIGIYKILLDMRADTFKEALNVWEQEKHNMVMEAKVAAMVN